MTARRILLLGLLVAGCRRPNTPAGEPRPLEVAGLYSMTEKSYSSDCPPRITRAIGIEARTKKISVEVSHSAPSTMMLMRVDAEPFDAQILENGSFEIRANRSSSVRARDDY